MKDVELLDFLLKRKNISKKLLEKYCSFRNIFDQDKEELESVVDERIAEKIILLKRFVIEYLEPDMKKKVLLSSPEAVKDYLRAEIGNLPRETFMLLCLNSNNELIHKEILFKGTINQANIYPREILKLAINKNAFAIIICHNHPSGNAYPSSEDRKITEQLKEISSGIGLEVHDHLIISKDSVYSIRSNKLV